mmetsp:Transcript_35390/g.77921  ORF Transcript_35390/g.77921 Transcript_35390/m.77921 type:complete len:312 (-) Transcript_35390:928-1863(-)
MDCTAMLRRMGQEIRLEDRLYGLRSSSSGVGASVPSASAPIVSITRFTHSSCTAVSGSSNPSTAPANTIDRATRLTVSWNCRNLRMLSYTALPQEMARTMELNLSSRMTMSAAPCATLVPVMPIASPTSAAFRAGASLVPSPVTPTTSPPSGREASHSSLYPGSSRSLSFSHDTPSLPSIFASHSTLPSGMAYPFRRVTRRYLSSGEERAMTCRLGSIASTSLGVIPRNLGPSTAVPCSVRMPHCLAMAMAVAMLSPVTMRTVTPAACATRTASFTSDRRGSMMPTMQSSVSSKLSGGFTAQSSGIAASFA